MRMARAGVVLVGVLVAATALAGTPAASAATARGSVTWSPPLTGEAVGIVVAGRTARLAPDRASLGTARADGHGAVGAPGLLTLPAHRVDVPVDRVDATLTLEAGSPPSAATVDVRGVRAGGRWTEWEPADGTDRDPATVRTLTATLPDPVVAVQTRLVLSPGADATTADPVVRDVTLTARAATRTATRTESAADGEPRQHRVFATREGLVGGTTANGHVITDRDLFVALPSRRDRKSVV